MQYESAPFFLSTLLLKKKKILLKRKGYFKIIFKLLADVLIHTDEIHPLTKITLLQNGIHYISILQNHVLLDSILDINIITFFINYILQYNAQLLYNICCINVLCRHNKFLKYL